MKARTLIRGTVRRVPPSSLRVTASRPITPCIIIVAFLSLRTVLDRSSCSTHGSLANARPLLFLHHLFFKHTVSYSSGRTRDSIIIHTYLIRWSAYSYSHRASTSSIGTVLIRIYTIWDRSQSYVAQNGAVELLCSMFFWGNSCLVAIAMCSCMQRRKRGINYRL